MTPSVSMSTSQSTTSAGTPIRDHAIFWMFLLTVSKAFDMSYEVLLETPQSIFADSRIFMKRIEADMVPRPGTYPCCAELNMFRDLVTERILDKMRLIQAFLVASVSISGLRSAISGVSVGFFGAGTSQRHFQCVGMCLSVQNCARQS